MGVWRELIHLSLNLLVHGAKADADLAKQVRGESAEFDHYEYQIVEQDEPASPDEGSMAMQQLEFMSYAAGKMKEHLSSGGEFP